MNTLRQKLREEAEMLAQLRDSTGTRHYSGVIHEFDVLMQTMALEREKQYKNMRRSLKLIEDIEINEMGFNKHLIQVQSENQTRVRRLRKIQ
jgi:hypothetical protein